MGHSVLTTPDLNSPGNWPAVHFAGPLREADASVWSSLASNLWDAFFRREPPLELTSKPVAVADPMAIKRDPTSSVISFVMHGAMIAAILFFALQAHKRIVPKPAQVTTIDIQPYIPVTAPAPQSMGGGGGGGAHDIVPPSRGHIPPVAQAQVAPPEILKVDRPKLAAAPTVVMPKQIDVADNNTPNIALPNSPQVMLASQGSGSASGFGQGIGGGIGSGHSAGVGPGSGGGYGGGVMSVGGGVSAPQLIHSVEPDFTDEARRAKHEGVVSIQLIVDSLGDPHNIHVVRRLGMGLDEKAIEAVSQYKFRPAMYQGHPVAVQVMVDVNFHLY